MARFHEYFLSYLFKELEPNRSVLNPKTIALMKTKQIGVYIVFSIFINKMYYLT